MHPSRVATFMPMECKSDRLSYKATGAFSRIVTDYLDKSAVLQPFYSHFPDLDGINAAINERRKVKTNREVLVRELRKQYENINTTVETEKNISLLINENTFTITTAHQPNLFTGPLYFIYKILHVIRLADSLKSIHSELDFVPVYYMGSEDADLEELGHFYMQGVKYTWETAQSGAVGRMLVDKKLINLINAIEGQIGVHPYGAEIVDMIKQSYKEGDKIQDATFRFVNALFGKYGLVILLPDNSELKKLGLGIFEDDLLNQTASELVEHTGERLSNSGYKVQANPREINLFYLKDNLRERIEQVNGEWKVVNGTARFTKEALKNEIEQYPERFSPNVILRGLYQETLLPNIAFVGGGGEVAYWLQLKDLFTHYKVPFPILVLRNSFLFIEEKWSEKIQKLRLGINELFLPQDELLSHYVKNQTNHEIRLNGTLTELEQLYETFKKQAAAVDSTLGKHVDALKVKTVQHLHELEKKMLRAEKRKFSDAQRQITRIKEALFPNESLQERVENMVYFYSKWGMELIEKLYEQSPVLEQEFIVLRCK